jgi:hypothetical protein
MVNVMARLMPKDLPTRMAKGKEMVKFPLKGWGSGKLNLRGWLRPREMESDSPNLMARPMQMDSERPMGNGSLP